MLKIIHYNDLIMGLMASQIPSLTIVYSVVYSGADQRKHQNSVSLAFVRGIHRGPVNSPHKWPVTRKMFPFDEVIMRHWNLVQNKSHTLTSRASYGVSIVNNITVRKLAVFYGAKLHYFAWCTETKCHFMTKCSALDALEASKMTTSCTAIDNFVKMMTFSF